MLRHAAVAGPHGPPRAAAAITAASSRCSRTTGGGLADAPLPGSGPDVAADATQEVFLVAAQRLADIAVGKERAFLIGTALHVAQAAQRTRARWDLAERRRRAGRAATTVDDRGRRWT
jgi:hypothetical protein